MVVIVVMMMMMIVLHNNYHILMMIRELLLVLDCYCWYCYCWERSTHRSGWAACVGVVTGCCCVWCVGHLNIVVINIIVRSSLLHDDPIVTK